MTEIELQTVDSRSFRRSERRPRICIRALSLRHRRNSVNNEGKHLAAYWYSCIVVTRWTDRALGSTNSHHCRWWRSICGKERLRQPVRFDERLGSSEENSNAFSNGSRGMDCIRSSLRGTFTGRAKAIVIVGKHRVASCRVVSCQRMEKSPRLYDMQ